MEPSPFSPRWFSHKINGPGVQYKIASTIQTGELVWINRPFPCGTWTDLRIARYALVDALDPGEYYLANGGYSNRNQYSQTPTGQHDFSDCRKATVCARHKSYNKQLKDWGALRCAFRHALDSHSKIFQAIASVVQVTIMNGEPLLDVEYHHYSQLAQ
jgi:hypothetical protein